MDLWLTNLQKRGRNVFLTQGVLGLVAGAVIILWPGATLAIVAYVAAAWIAVDGALAILWSLRARSGGFARGVVQLLIAVLIALAPAAFAAFILFVVSGAVLLLGLINLLVALAMRRAGVRNWWGFLIVAIVSLAVGILMVVFPRESLTSILWVFGAIAILQGIAFIALGLRISRSVCEAENAHRYRDFDGIIEGEVVEDRRSTRRAVEGEIIDEEP